MKYPHDSWYACIFFPSYLSEWLHLRKFFSYLILDFVWDAAVPVHNTYWGSCPFIAYRTDIPLFFYMEDNFPVSITEASYWKSPVVMYIHLSVIAVLTYISSYSIYMVGATLFIFTSFISGLNVVKLFCINTNSFLMSFWQKHNTMNLLFMLFFYFFFHPHIYYRATFKKKQFISHL